MIGGACRAPAQIRQEVPAVLNEEMLNGTLDIGPLSALWYGKHQNEFLLLPDVSISSESTVQSVLLFSRYPIRDLAGKRIFVTNQGRTTPALLEILCKLRYGFEPDIKTSQFSADQMEGEAPDAVLLIGDQALSARYLSGSMAMQAYDLAQEWKDWTGKPLVFAVWAVRRDIFAGYPEKVLEVHEAVLKSRDWGLRHPGAVIQEAQRRLGISADVLKAYFSNLHYQFDENLRSGLKLYFEMARQCDILTPVGDWEEIPRRPALVRSY